MIQNLKSKVLLLPIIGLIFCCSSSSDTPTEPDNTPVKSDVSFWLTTADGSIKLAEQTNIYKFGTTANTLPNIEIDASQTYQTIDGFGYTLTGGSVETINTLTATKRQELLQNLFGKTANDIGVSYIRISIGASDLSSSVYTYNEMPAGQTDPFLSNFSLAKDDALIAMLKDILAINPNIKIMACPWTAPTWMKTNQSFIGGSLKTENYSVYARYFVRYIQAMKAQGITIDAITPQNEPLHAGNNPSLYMQDTEQTLFVKSYLGPAFKTANITTKIVIYDHNCDKPSYPINVLSDAVANPFIDGSAFHLYAGDISALSTVHNAFPTKNVYFTEQWTSSTGDFGGDLKWHTKNVIIGSMRNWSKTALEWNLSNDSNYKPYTPNGGCSMCKGAITINSSGDYSKNVSYYIIAHASKFVPMGSVRIGSTQYGNVNTVAFKTPENKIAVIVENDGTSTENFNLKYNSKWVTFSLNGGAVGTFVF